MARAKGSIKIGGRVKGTPNRRTTELKGFFDSVNFSLPEEIYKLLDKLTPEKRLDTLLKLLEYIYPKRKALEAPLEEDTTESKELDLKRLTQEELLFLQKIYKKQNN
jgi:hypothetical protein